MEFKQPDKRIRFCWTIYTLLVAIIPLVIVCVLAERSLLSRRTFYGSIMALLAVLMFIILLYHPFRYRRMRYSINTEVIVVVRGFFFSVYRQIPGQAVRHITSIRGPVERLMGITTLFISASGGFLVVEGIPNDEASALTKAFL